MIDHFCRLTMLGRATADAVRVPGGSKAVVAFGFVFNDRYKEGDKWIDKPMFIDCEAFGDLAERVYKDVRKGYLVLIDGKLRFDQWTDREKKTHRKHKVILTGCRVMDKPKPKAEPPAEVPEKQADSLFPPAAQSSEPEPL